MDDYTIKMTLRLRETTVYGSNDSTMSFVKVRELSGFMKGLEERLKEIIDADRSNSIEVFITVEKAKK